GAAVPGRRLRVVWESLFAAGAEGRSATATADCVRDERAAAERAMGSVSLMERSGIAARPSLPRARARCNAGTGVGSLSTRPAAGGGSDIPGSSYAGRPALRLRSLPSLQFGNRLPIRWGTV